MLLDIFDVCFSFAVFWLYFFFVLDFDLQSHLIAPTSCVTWIARATVKWCELIATIRLFSLQIHRKCRRRSPNQWLHQNGNVAYWRGNVNRYELCRVIPFDFVVMQTIHWPLLKSVASANATLPNAPNSHVRRMNTNWPLRKQPKCLAAVARNLFALHRNRHAIHPICKSLSTGCSSGKRMRARIANAAKLVK